MNPELCITTDYKNEWGPIEPKLQMLAQAGFRWVHWGEHWCRDTLYEDFYTAGVGQALRRTGLRLLDTHGAEMEGASPSAADECARRQGARLLENRIRFTAELGGDCVVVHPGPYNPQDPAYARRWENLERTFTEVAPLCEQLRIRIGLENLQAPAPPAFERQMQALPPAVLGFCYDSGHANIARQPELIERYATRLAALHLHDNAGQRDEHATPGQGTVDWGLVFRALHSCGYAKPINFELMIRDERPPSEFFREAFAKATDLLRTHSV